MEYNRVSVDLHIEKLRILIKYKIRDQIAIGDLEKVNLRNKTFKVLK